MPNYKQSVTQFIIEIYVDGKLNDELTTHFTTLRIINSTRSAWPIYYIYFTLDNQIIIEQNIYGIEDITVKVWYTTENGEKKGEPMTYDLIYMESNLDLPPKHFNNTPYQEAKEAQRRVIMFSCVAKQAFLVMTQFINKLWEEETNLRPIDFIKEILELRDIEYIINEDGCNEETVQQLIIPPMTIKNSVDYINERFGIFEGPMFRYVNYSGQFLMWDLKKQYDLWKASGFTKHHKLPSYTETNVYEEVQDMVAKTSDQFVTYDMVEALNYGNAVISRYGYDNIYITHPHEDIMHHLKFDADTIIKDYCIWHDKDEMKYHKDLKHRKLYYHDMKGFETGSGYSGVYDDHILKTDMADNFKDAASIRFTLYRNVKISLCEKVGEVLYLMPYSSHEKWEGANYEGGYLVSDSEIILTRNQRGEEEDNINCIAIITGYRTAQSKD